MRGFARWRFVAAEGLAGVLAALVSLTLAVVALNVQFSDLGLRWTTGAADQVLHYAIFSSALDTFPFVPNPDLGFPGAQNLFFAPLFDIWSSLFVTAISPFVPNGVWALNLYNLGSFASVGFTSYAFFRALKLRRSTGLVFGVVFALVPFHFSQLAAGHPFLSNYWALPLAGILVLMVAGERTDPFAGWVGRASTHRQRTGRRIAPIIVLVPLVGLTQSYYFVFATLIVGGVWFVRVVATLSARTSWRQLIWPTVVTFSLVLVVGAQLAILSLNLDDRYARYFQDRTVEDSESGGGKFLDLLLPSAQSGFSPLARFADAYRSTSKLLPFSESAATAVVASIAICICLVLIAVRLLAPRARSHRRADEDARIDVLLVGFFIALLFFIASGLGALLALVISPEIRAWSRMSIVVSMFALGVLALLIEKLAGRPWARRVGLAVVAAIALVDQTGAIAQTLPLAVVDDSALRQFAVESEDLLPDGCGVVELPLKTFPESGGFGQMGDYDEALPYVFTKDDDLRFSYGAVRGTKDADFWQGADDPATFSQRVEASGACALIVDLYAYVEIPGAWKAFVAQTGVDPQKPAVTSQGDGRYELFVLPL